MEIAQIQRSENRSQALTWKYQQWQSVEMCSFELDFVEFLATFRISGLVGEKDGSD